LEKTAQGGDVVTAPGNVQLKGGCGTGRHRLVDMVVMG